MTTIPAQQPRLRGSPGQRVLAFAAFSYLGGDDSVSSALNHCRQLDEGKSALLRLVRVAEIRSVLPLSGASRPKPSTAISRRPESQAPAVTSARTAPRHARRARASLPAPAAAWPGTARLTWAPPLALPCSHVLQPRGELSHNLLIPRRRKAPWPSRNRPRPGREAYSC